MGLIRTHEMKRSAALRTAFGPGHRVFAVLAVAALPVAASWLQPWKLFIRTIIDEPLPASGRTVYLGHFRSDVHKTSGSARIVILSDGRRILRIENLHTTLGPQLRVWLSDRRATDGGNRFRRVGRYPHLDVGPVRANRGNANYAIPYDADTGELGSVVLWCKRFGVSFGAAQLHRAR
jgi:hypothetical protein